MKACRAQHQGFEGEARDIKDNLILSVLEKAVWKTALHPILFSPILKVEEMAFVIEALVKGKFYVASKSA